MNPDRANANILKRVIEFDQRGAVVFYCKGHVKTATPLDIELESTNVKYNDMVTIGSNDDGHITDKLKKIVAAHFRTSQEQEFDLVLRKDSLFYKVKGQVVILGDSAICYLSDKLGVSDTPYFMLKMLEQTADLIALVDASFCYVSFNLPYKNEIKKVYGVDLQPGMSLLDAVGGNEEDYAKALPAWQHAFDGHEFKAEGAFGSESTLYEYAFNPLKDENGQISNAILTVRDISRFRQLEMESVDRSKLQTLLNQTPDIIVKIDPSLNCQYVNGSIQRFGINYSKIIGKNFYDLNISQRDRDRLLPYFKSVMKGERVEIFDTFKIKGLDFDLHIIFIPQKNERNEVTSAIITCHDLTALNTLKQKFRAIFDGTFQFMGLMDTKGRILEVNKPALEFIDIGLTEVLGQYIWDSPWFFGEENLSVLKEAVTEVANGGFVRRNMPIKDKNGDVIIIDFSLKPVRDDKGDVVYLLPEGRDISDLLEAEKKLEEMEEFTFMADNLPHIIWTADNKGVVKYINETFRQVTGLTDKDVSEGSMRHKMLHPDELEEVFKSWSVAIEKGNNYSAQHRIRQRSGEYAWYHTKVNPMRNQKGEIVKWHGSAFDIDELKRTSMALNTLNRHLQELTDAMPVIIWTGDENGITDYFNKRWCEITGMEVEESIKSGWKRAIHPDDLQTSQKVWSQKIQKNKPFQVEYRLKCYDGNYRWFLEEGRPYFDNEGKLLKWVGTATDIQDQHDTSQLMTLKAEEFETMTETIPQVVWTAESHGRLLFLSNKWKEWTGMDVENSLDEGWLQSVADEDRMRVKAKYDECIKEGVPFFAEFKLTDLHGNPFWVLALGSPARQNGEVTKWFGTFTDISIQKEIEEYKDAFLRIAGHELRTPLTSLMATLGLLKRLPLNDPDFPEYLRKSYEATVKLKNLITDLLDVSTSRKAHFSYHDEPFSLDNMIEETVEDYKKAIKTHQFELSGTIGQTIKADRVRLEQVFNNLLQNAVKYSPDNEYIQIIRSYTDGEAVIKIIDHGMGVDEVDRPQIFKKFYRAEKNKSIRGMGLGLYMAASIVNHYDGSITLESKSGEGSIFTVKLKIESPE
ncbi:PAS domain S-box protein [Roseivirga sp. BDSF3-8]|uniref:PAS domain S-box protein n=1 Tax=Roseivirga sp. BDSF3-8 TaxID=3241598 RepID=UPI003531DB0B